jgi:hypothetical protein
MHGYYGHSKPSMGLPSPHESHVSLAHRMPDNLCSTLVRHSSQRLLGLERLFGLDHWFFGFTVRFRKRGT